ncbi:hypothetical protein TWF281_005909 [Arthrobotrys megalospora]
MTALSFQDASKAYLDSFKNLSDDEKVHFDKLQKPDDIITQLKTLKAPGFTRDRSQRAIKRITTFIERITPYFKIVDIAIQSDPTIASLVWSSIRLVVQLGLNFSSFMDKLTHMIERIGLMLPMYERYVNVFKHKVPKPLEESLRRVYSDLLLFFHECIKIFAKGRSRLPKTPRLIANLLWVPFDTRFGEILDRIQEQHAVIKEEAQIASMTFETAERKEQEKERERQQKSREKLERILKLSESEKAERIQKSKTKVIRKCLKWISPGKFTGPFERALNTREEGTAGWIFDTPEYRQWEEDGNQIAPSSNTVNKNILWISGPPGRGKTIWTGSIAERLQNTFDSNNLSGASSAYFFFEQKGSETYSENAYRAILAQILTHNSQDEAVVDRVSFIMNDKQTGQLQASQQQLLDTLNILIPSLGITAFVVDGVDECRDRKALVSNLFRLALSPNVKLILLSRPNVPELCKKSSHILTLVLESNAVRGDIGIYLQRNLSDMQSNSMLPSGLDFQDAYNRLLNGANGMFLWAHLMVNLLLSEVLTPWQRRQIIVSVILPEGLEEIYGRIFDFIGNRGSAERRIAQIIFSWITNPEIVMSTAELRLALRLVIQGVEGLEDDISDDAVIIACAGLVEKDYTGGQFVFRPIHLSLMEYLTEGEHMTGKLQWMRTCNVEIHEELAIACLKYLTYAVPAGPLAGKIGVESKRWAVAESFPFIGYAATKWIPHLKEVTKGYIRHNSANSPLCRYVHLGNIPSAVQTFISHKVLVMTWIEARYLFSSPLTDSPASHRFNFGHDFQDIGIVGANLNDISASAPSNFITTLSQRLSQLSADLEQLDKDWRSALSKEPYKLWLDVTAFSKSEFWLETSATTVEMFNVEENGQTLQELGGESNLNRNSAPFAAADCVHEDGSMMGILTIHSPPGVNDLLKRATPLTFKDLHQCSSGWRAKYEIWDLQKPAKRVSQTWIELSREEVWIQLCQTLRRDRNSRQWNIQFPLAMKADLRLFSILRTVYRFEISQNITGPSRSCDAGAIRVVSLKLPVEDLPQAFKNWHSSVSLERVGSTNINDAEHFFEYSLGFGPSDSYIAYTHHESGNMKRAVAVFKLLWDNNYPRADILGSRSFVGGPSLEKIAFGLYHVEQIDAQLRVGAKNCSKFAVEGMPGLVVGRSLLAFHPQRTTFGVLYFLRDKLVGLYIRPI